MLFPETSSIVINIKKIIGPNECHLFNSHVLYNFAFGKSFRGVIKSAFDAVRIAENNGLMICHIRSSAEFSNLLCTKPIFTMRLYAALKQINTCLIFLLSKLKRIKFSTLTLPIVLHPNSSWDKYLRTLNQARVPLSSLGSKLLVCELGSILDCMIDINNKSSIVAGEVITLSELLKIYDIDISTRTNLLEKSVWNYARIIDIIGGRLFITILIKLGMIDRSCILAFELHDS